METPVEWGLILVHTYMHFYFLFKISYSTSAAPLSARPVCSHDTSIKQLTFAYTWRLLIDGVEVVSYSDNYVIYCYMLVNGNTIYRDYALHNSFEAFGVYGGFEYKHSGLASIILVENW